MEILGYLASAVSLVCWIMVLIKLFDEGVLQGILGIICGLWAFVWGWMNVGPNNQKNVMIAWTIALIVSIAANVAMR